MIYYLHWDDFLLGRFTLKQFGSTAPTTPFNTRTSWVV